MDNNQIRRMVKRGDFDWRDITPIYSSFSRYSEVSIKGTSKDGNAKSNDVSSRPEEQAALSENKNDKYNAIDWTADIYKNIIIGKNLSQIGKSAGDIKQNIAPSMLLVDWLSEDKNDPKFYDYLRKINEIQKVDKKSLDSGLAEVLSNRGLSEKERRLKYEASLAKERALKDPSPLSGYAGDIAQFVGEGLSTVAEWAKDITKLPGDIYSMFDEDQDVLPTSAQERNSKRLSIASGNVSINPIKSANKFANEYAGDIALNAAGIVAGGGVLSRLGKSTIAKSAITAASTAVLGAVAYNSSDLVNNSTGYRDIGADELPSDMAEIHSRYWPTVKQWSKIPGKYKSLFPSMEEVISGKTIQDGWQDNAKKTIKDDYSSRIGDIERDIEDKNHIKFLGLNVGQPSERSNSDLYDPSSAASIARTVGMSMPEMGAMAGVIGTGIITSIAAKNVARLGKYSPIMVSSIKSLVDGSSNAYLSRMLRESEAGASISEDFNLKQDEYLKKNGVKPLSSLSDSELIGYIKPNTSEYVSASKKLASGKFTEFDRYELESSIRTGLTKSSIPQIGESISYANNGLDEVGRQYMSMIYSDMASNAIISMPFYFPKIAKYAKDGSSISKVFGDAAKDFSEHLYKSRIAGAIASSIPAKIVKTAASTGARVVGDYATELFLEENPQWIIDKKYVNNELRTNSTALGVINDTYGSAITGGLALFGMSGDERYDNNPDLLQNAISTLYMTMAMGAGGHAISTYSNIKDDMAKNAAKKFVNGNVLSRMKTSNREAKTDVYVDKLIKNKQDEVIDHLSYLANNPPAGVSREEMLDELDLAKKTISVANNRNVVRFANQSAGYGSTDHKLLTSLVVDHIASSKYAKEFILNNLGELTNAARDEAANSDFINQDIVTPMSSESVKADMYKELLFADQLSRFPEYVDNHKSEFSSNKTSILNAAIKKNKKDSAKRLFSIASSLGIEDKIGVSDWSSFDSIMAGISDSDNIDIPSSAASKNAFNLIMASNGVMYDELMANRLQNIATGTRSRNKLSDDEYNVFVDKHLDAYRTARKNEELDDENIESLYDKINNEKQEKEKPEIVDEPISKSTSGSQKEDSSIQKESDANESAQTESASAESLISEANKIIETSTKGKAGAGEITDNNDGRGTESYKGIDDDGGSVKLANEEEVKQNGNEVDEEVIAESKNTEEEANDAASDIISSSNIISIAAEDEDSSSFYEIEYEFPGSIDDPGVEAKYDKISHTLITPNKDAQKFLMTPGSLDGAKIEISVSRILDKNIPDYRRDKNDINPYTKGFDINDKSTWDDAWIEIKITKKDKSESHKFNISLPDIAENRSFITTPTGETVRKFSDEEVDLLRKNRASIILEYKKVLGARGKKHLTAVGGISLGKSKIALNRKNGLAVQRSLYKIKGMIDGFDGADFKSIGKSNITLAYGRGAKGVYDIVGIDSMYGFTTEQNSGSLFAVKKDPINGSVRNIKINKQRFRDKDSIASLIYRLAVDLAATNQQVVINRSGEIEVVSAGSIAELGVTASGLLTKIVSFGDSTIIDRGEESKFPHLVPKQFFIDGSTLHFGENTIDISSPASISADRKQEVIDYIKSNFNWTVSKNDVWNDQGNDNKVYNLFPGLNSYFINNKNAKTVKFCDGFEISRDDMDLTWTGWLIKNDKLVSDVGDGIFDAPFAFIDSIVATDTNKSSDSAASANESKEVLKNTKDDDILSSQKTDDLSTEEGSQEKTSLFTIKSNKRIRLGGKPRIKSSATYDKTVSDEEYSWLSSRLGVDGQNLDVVDKVIELAGNVNAMGLMTGDSIMLWDGAEEGTAYHEGFHRVSLMLINRVRRMTMYEQVRLSSPEMKNATNSEIEEYLAENFRKWRLSKSLTGMPSMVKQLFGRIFNFIKSARNLGMEDINRIYSDIESGVFKNKSISKKNKSEFFLKYKNAAPRLLKDKGFEYIDTLDIQYSLVNGLVNALFDVSDIKTVNDIAKLKSISSLKGIVEETIRELEESNASDKTIGIYKDVLSRFDSEFAPLIEDKIFSMGIKQYNQEEDSDDSEIVSSEVSRYGLADYEVSKKDNIPFEVKFFLSTIDNVEEVEEDGSIYIQSVQNPVTMLNEFVDQGVAWKRVVSDLHDEPTAESMLSKIDKLADANGIPFYKALKERLSGYDNDFVTKMWTSVNSHVHEFVNIAENKSATFDGEDKSLRVVDLDINDSAYKMPLIWGENFIANGFIYAQDGPNLKFNKDNAALIVSEYERLSRIANGVLNKSKVLSDSDVNDMYYSYIDLFKKIGIDIDDETIEAYISDKFQSEPRDGAIALLRTKTKSADPSFIFSNIMNSILRKDGAIIKNKKEIQDKKRVFSGERSAKNLAAAHSKAHIRPNESTSIGTDGKKIYKIALKNYVIDLFQKLRQDRKFLKKFASSTFISGSRDFDGSTVVGSVAIKQLLSGQSSGIYPKTFLKYYQERTGDPGVDYTKLSRIEDYIIKMAAIFDGYMVMPTIADKKTWYLLSGISMPNFTKNPISYDSASGMMSIPVDSLNIFHDYFYTEFQCIKSAFDAFISANGDKSKLEQVYHYGGVNQWGVSKYTDKKGRWLSGLGNGMHFRNFDIVRISTSDGSSRTINLNDEIERFVSENGIERGMQMFFDFMDRSYFGDSVAHADRLKTISNTLKLGIKNELDWAIKNGIITQDGQSNVYKNSKLDDALFSSIASLYHSGDSTSIPDSAATSAILNMITANFINTSISNIEFDKLIAKDSAFYKDPDAKMKRHSSMLSTGTPLRVDFPSGHELCGEYTFNSAELNDNEISSVNLSEIKDRMAAAFLYEWSQEKSKYTYSDFYNSYTAADGVAMSDKQMYDKATELADSYSNGYSNVNETDATVYISPDMYRSILKRSGKWNYKYDEAFSLLESDDLSWMSDSEKYLKAMEVAMNPLKMIYYGDAFKGDLNVPKLDKMAMFCLFKPIATGDLSHLYNRMNNPAPGQEKIHMVAFSSAVKVGNNKPIDFYSAKDESSISNLDNLSVEKQYFEYLRDQLSTEPHEGSMVNLATQVQKVSMSNVLPDKLYSNINIDGIDGATGSRIVSEWKNAISELSNIGRKKIERELGIRNNNGDVTINIKKLYSFLSKEARRSGMPMDVIEILNEYSESGVSDVSIQAMADNDWIESKIVSKIMKATIDIETPGGMFIQMSAFGVKNINSVDDSSFGYAVNNGKRLSFLNKDGGMDCVISASMFKDVMPDDIKSASIIDQRNWLASNNLIGDNARPIAVGYRIPTQALSSIVALRVADILPSNIGDTIILPSEFTKLTGSDFDIDKLFVSRMNFSVSDGIASLIKFNDAVDNPYKDNGEKAIQNRMLECMIAVVSEPSSISETRVPIDKATDELKDVVLKDIESIIGNKKEPSPLRFVSPSYHTDKKIEYSTGKKNLGPFALANTHHVLTQISGLSVNQNKTTSKFGIVDVSSIYGRDGVRILDWLSAMINAHVDVAKDPYIIRLGVNDHTIKMATFLLRAGFGRDTFYFLSQPSLTKLYSVLDSSSGIYKSDQDSKQNINGAINKIISVYMDAIGSLKKTDQEASLYEAIGKLDEKGREIIDNSHVLNNKNLRDWLSEDNSFYSLYNQVMVLKTFLELSPYANELAEITKYSQIDTKKAGTTFLSQIEFETGMREVEDNNSAGVGLFSSVKSLFDSTFIRAKADNSIGTVKNIGRNILFRTSTGIQDAISLITSMTGRNGVDNSKFSRRVSKYIDAEIKSEFFAKYISDNDIDLKSLFFGENTVAKKLYLIKSKISNGELDELLNNEFIKSITYQISSSQDGLDPDHITLIDNGSNDVYMSEKIRNYFNELLTSGNEYISRFAKEFIAYQYYSTGDNSAINYIKLSEYDRRRIGLYKFIQDKLIDVNAAEYEYPMSSINSVFMNRWYDNDLVPEKENKVNIGYSFNDVTGMFEDKYIVFPTIYSKAKLYKNKKAGHSGESYPVLWIDKNPTRTSNLIGLGESNKFAQYVKYKVNHSSGDYSHVLYKNMGTIVDKDNIYPVYGAIRKFGDKSRGLSIVEHGIDQSIIRRNNISEYVDFEVTKENVEARYGASDLSKMISSMTPAIDVQSISEYGYHADGSNISLKSSNMGEIVSRSVSSGVVSIADAISFAESNGIDKDAAIAEYAKGILSSSEELIMNSDQYIKDQSESALNELKIALEDSLLPYVSESKEDNSGVGEFASVYSNTPTTGSFQGYVGGFDNAGEWTPEGDGKDKAMREVADGFIGEILKSNSSTLTSFNELRDSGNKFFTEGTNASIHNSSVVMLARNSEYKGKPLLDSTKEKILIANSNGAEFVVGDMPGVDSAFIDFLKSIGAKFSVYHTGNSPRIDVTKEGDYNPDAAGSVTEELYTEYGTKYKFNVVYGVPVSGSYMQNGLSWVALNKNNIQKIYNRLVSKADTGTADQSNIIVDNNDDENKILFAGKNISLSSIGVDFALNDGQKKLIESVSSWVESESKSPISVIGYAGTGKTTITKIITAGLSAAKIKFKLASPTHTAKGVLSSKTGNPASTIHSLLKMGVDEKSMIVGQNIQFNDARYENIPKNGVVIIDESSMIPNKIVDFIVESAAAVNSKVLFIGDSAQFDPINNNNSSTGTSSRSKSLDFGGTEELTEVMRVSNDNPLIEVPTALRKAQSPDIISRIGDVKTSAYARRNAYNENGGAVWIGEKGRASAIKFAIDEYFKSDEYKENDNFVKFIAYRNVVVDALNDMVRDALGRTGVIEQGESVVGQVKMSSQQAKGKALIENDDEYKVSLVSNSPKTIRSIAVPGVDLSVVEVTLTPTKGDSIGGRFNLLIDYSSEKIAEMQNAILKKKDEISKIYDIDQAEYYRRSREFYNSINNDFITIKNIPNPLVVSDNDSDALKKKSIRHYHAITGHKAQGKEFNNVIVDDSDLRRMSSGLDDIQYKKAIYTSVSRAKDRAIIITDGGRYDVASSSFLNSDESNSVPQEFALKQKTGAESNTSMSESDINEAEDIMKHCK